MQPCRISAWLSWFTALPTNGRPASCLSWLLLLAMAVLLELSAATAAALKFLMKFSNLLYALLEAQVNKDAACTHQAAIRIASATGNGSGRPTEGSISEQESQKQSRQQQQQQQQQWLYRSRAALATIYESRSYKETGH